MAAVPQELRIATRYLGFAARAWGPPGAAPVLALHGWLDNAASFDGLAPLLPELRVLALDLAGHGCSDWRPPGVHYHFVDFVEDVVSVADALDWQRFSLLGHSLGAAIASCAAAVVPERVSRLVLIEGLGPLAGEPARGPIAHAQAMRQMRELPQKRPPRYADLDRAARAREAAGDLSHQSARVLSSRGTRRVPDGLTWRSDPRVRFRSPHYLSEPQVLAYLRRISAPTLLVVASQGLLPSRPGMAERRFSVPHLTVRTVAGGHHLHLDAPADVAAVIYPFLRAGAP